MKSYLLCCFDHSILRGYKFCKIDQMVINSISDRRNMTYEQHMNQPMQPVELRLKLMVAKNPQLIKSLDRNINHPLTRKYSHIPFTN